MLADATDQLERVLAAVHAALGACVLGACLHGSTATGRLRPDSDLDLLVVAGRHLTAEEKRDVIARILPISGRGDPTGASRPVELTIVAHHDLNPWRYPPPMELLYGDWWRTEFLAVLENPALPWPWPDPNPDLAVLVTMALGADRSIFGPGPSALLAPVPSADLRRAILDAIPGLLADLELDTRNVLLTLARIWCTLATGEIRSKDDAADWALERLPPDERAAMAYARANYLEGGQERWAELGQAARVRPLADRLLAAIETLRAEA